MRNLRALTLLAAALPSGCIPSNVVAAEDRAIAAAPARLTFDAPVPATLEGLYESVQIDGAIAHAMWKVYYHFATGGRFTGAALVLENGLPTFQTLAGEYRIADGRITLGVDAEPASLAAAPGHVRMSTDDGQIVFRRVGD